MPAGHISGVSWNPRTAPRAAGHQRLSLAKLRPGLLKRHDDRIDGEDIAGLNVYFRNCRIELGAESRFHFHRLDDAEGFAGPYRDRKSTRLNSSHITISYA